MKQESVPSVQEIQDYLDGLNRVYQAHTVSADTPAARQRGISNYRQWFKSRDITIHLDRKTQMWKLGTPPQGEQETV